MRDIREMEAEAARVAAMTPEQRAAYDAELLEHRRSLGLEPPAALADIAAERRRQVETEGWTPEHDDEHGNGSMALAAACYAMFASASDAQRIATTLSAGLTADGQEIPGWSAWLSLWPWDRKWWKPKDRRRDLVRAGALIVAEIERLDRAAQSKA